MNLPAPLAEPKMRLSRYALFAEWLPWRSFEFVRECLDRLVNPVAMRDMNFLRKDSWGTSGRRRLKREARCGIQPHMTPKLISRILVV